MTPASAHLLELLGQLRGASRLGRARVLALAAKALRDLSPDERRVLATEAARRVAPDLLGQVDDLVEEKLGAAEAGKFVELFNQMDGDAIADLARDVAAALDETEATAADEVVAVTPPGQHEDDDMDLIADVSLDETSGHMQPVELVAELSDLPPSLDEPWQIVAGDHEELPSPVPPVAPVAAAAAGLAVLPRPTKEELVLALDEEPSEPPVDPVQLLSAEPDGWRRRRLAQRLIEAGHVTAQRAVEVVATLDAPRDRAWIAGALIDARLLEPGDVLDLVPTRTHASLWRRAGW